MNWRILLLSNRTILKEQNSAELGDNETIVVKTYQALENHSGRFGLDTDELLAGFDIVVMDEAHYLFLDSAFNRNTDVLLSLLKMRHDAITIMITATPEVVLSHSDRYDYIYDFPRDYSYIKDIYFFESDETVQRILNEVPDNEKAIVFCSDAASAFEMSIDTPSSAFVCSDGNQTLGRKSSKKTITEIVEHGKFSCKVLFATKVLDNGINIVDDAVKHMIIDMMNPADFLQCLGRKRIVDAENITLYFKVYRGNRVAFALRGIREAIKMVDELKGSGKELFAGLHVKDTLDPIFQTDMSINHARLSLFLWLKTQYEAMLQNENGFLDTIVGLLTNNGQTTTQMQQGGRLKKAELFFEQKNILQILEKYEGVKMFETEREEFKKEFFRFVYDTKKTNFRKRGINSISAILEEDRLPFVIVSLRENAKGANRNKAYWKIVKGEEK
jgi:hypothetical protein